MTETEYLNKLDRDLRAAQDDVIALQNGVNAMNERARSVLQEIEAMPGRRVAFALSGELTFTIANNRLTQRIALEPSQEGPFVLTHYPVISWSPSNTGATAFGISSPIRSWPLPTQQVFRDCIDISYQLVDSGSERGLQTVAVPTSGQLISTGDNIIPMPMPTMFVSNTRISVVITFNNISFDANATATTSGLLHVDLLGYRIVSV